MQANRYLLSMCTKRTMSTSSRFTFRMMQGPALLLRSSQVNSFAIMGNMGPVRNFAYHERVIDHYENPRNVGSFDKKASDVGTGLVGAPACGDVMKL